MYKKKIHIYRSIYQQVLESVLTFLDLHVTFLHTGIVGCFAHIFKANHKIMLVLEEICICVLSITNRL